MAFSAGTFNRLYSWVTDAANSINPSATRFDAEDDGFATGLSTCVLKDGTQTITANLPMSGFKFTGLGDGTAVTDSATVGQAQSGLTQWVDGGGSADAITGTYAPAVTAVTNGMMLRVRATAANATTTPTFSPNGLTARTIVKNNGAALVAGDIRGDQHDLALVYDATNTRWNLLNPAVTGALIAVTYYTSGAGTHTTAAGCRKMRVVCIGGGGGGAGAAAGGAAQVAIGSGGPSGAYAESLITSPAASYATSVGAGGGGGSDANGSDGGDTTFGVTVVVAKGGGHGTRMASAATIAQVNSTAPGAASGSTGDFKIDGRYAPACWRFSGTQGFATAGASSQFGDGGVGAGVSLATTTAGGGAATGYGAGGGGSISQNSAAATGGAGTGGLIIVWEFM